MRPEDMEKLMAAMNQQKIVYVIPKDEDNDDETVREIRKMVAATRR